MKMELIVSDAIDAIGYDEDTSTMRVKFHSGQTYEYAGVSKEKHQNLMHSESVGKHFQRHIRPHHQGNKV